jgi:hypothetical protein
VIAEYVLFAIVGRLIIFFAQKFPFSKVSVIGKYFGEGRFLNDLVSCRLCLGFWIYFILASIMRINVLEGYFAYIPSFNEIVTAITTSFLVHLVNAGWDAEYRNVMVN